MATSKSFSPELPGSFTGGLVNIQTKGYLDDRTLTFSTSLGYNPQANLNASFLATDRGAADGFALGSRNRALPAGLQNRQLLPARYSSSEANAELTRLGQSFNKTFVPVRRQSGLNQGYSFSTGNRKRLEGDRYIGYVASLTYKKKYSFYDDGVNGRYSLTGQVADVSTLNPELRLTETNGVENTLWGAHLNLGFEQQNHRISAVLMHNQNGIATARFLEGNFFSDDQDLILQTRALQYQERSVSTAQLHGQHLFPKQKKLKMNWLGSYVVAKQKEPDLRFFTSDYQLDGNDTVWSVSDSRYNAPSRYFREMREINVDTKINFELPLDGDNTAVLKFGASNVYKQRTFDEKRIDFKNQNVQFDGNVDHYFADENLVVGSDAYLYLVGNEGDDRRNSYRGTDRVSAGYFTLDAKTFKKQLRVITGARVEQTQIRTKSLESNLAPGVLDHLDLLPVVNLAWSLTDKMKLRASYTRTTARPFFRELAPFASFDFVGDFVVIGNPDLKRTLIDNFDFRWEVFPRRGELIAVSTFGKIFSNPIERSFNPQAPNGELTFLNVDQAQLYGIEVEWKKNLSTLNPKLKPFDLGGNITFVKSQVAIASAELAAIRAVNPTHASHRDMFGQSPYVVNLFIGFKSDSVRTWTANLTLNTLGPRLSVVGSKGLPDVVEQGRSSLGINVSRKLGRHFRVKASAGNLLNPTYTFDQTFKGTNYTYRSFKRGRTFGLSLAYSL